MKVYCYTRCVSAAPIRSCVPMDDASRVPVRFAELHTTLNRISYILAELLEPFISEKNLESLKRALAYWVC